MSCFVFLMVAAPGVGSTLPILCPLRKKSHAAPAGLVLINTSWVVPSMIDEHPETRKVRTASADDTRNDMRIILFSLSDTPNSASNIKFVACNNESQTPIVRGDTATWAVPAGELEATLATGLDAEQVEPAPCDGAGGAAADGHGAHAPVGGAVGGGGCGAGGDFGGAFVVAGSRPPRARAGTIGAHRASPCGRKRELARPGSRTPSSSERTTGSMGRSRGMDRFVDGCCP